MKADDPRLGERFKWGPGPLDKTAHDLWLLGSRDRWRYWGRTEVLMGITHLSEAHLEGYFDAE